MCHNPPLFHHTFCTSQKHSSWLYWFIPDTHNIYVSVNHNNLLHKIMPTAKYFESNESSSGHPRGLMQDISYIGVHFRSQTITMNTKVNGNNIIKISLKFVKWQYVKKLKMVKKVRNSVVLCICLMSDLELHISVLYLVGINIHSNCRRAHAICSSKLQSPFVYCKAETSDTIVGVSFCSVL